MSQQVEIEWEVDHQTNQTFDVWTERPGIEEVSTECLAGHYITAKGTRSGLRALARELFENPTAAYDDIDKELEELEEWELEHRD